MHPYQSVDDTNGSTTLSFDDLAASVRSLQIRMWFTAWAKSGVPVLKPDQFDTVDVGLCLEDRRSAVHTLCGIRVCLRPLV
ncbi:hypothetical protein ACVWYO_003627 [Sphingomonas sp. UYP23]